MTWSTRGGRQKKRTTIPKNSNLFDSQDLLRVDVVSGEPEPFVMNQTRFNVGAELPTSYPRILIHSGGTHVDETASKSEDRRQTSYSVSH